METKLIGSDVSNYTITNYIASGSFGNVYEAKHKKTGNLVALKIPIITKERNGLCTLIDEANIYKDISDKDYGIASMKLIKNGDSKIIVMDLFGDSLEKLLTKYSTFDSKTMTHIAVQMLTIMKHLHSCGYIHRDLKPDNFVIGRYNEKKKIYCIDFGLSKKFRNAGGEHISQNKKKGFCGTARFASIAAHKFVDQSRKDDLESIAYILIYLYKGKLPWQKIKNKDKHKRYALMGEMKINTSEEELCKDIPICRNICKFAKKTVKCEMCCKKCNPNFVCKCSNPFLTFLKYVKNMEFDEKPPYSSFIKMFREFYIEKNYKTDLLQWET